VLEIYIGVSGSSIPDSTPSVVVRHMTVLRLQDEQSWVALTVPWSVQDREAHHEQAASEGECERELPWFESHYQASARFCTADSRTFTQTVFSCLLTRVAEKQSRGRDLRIGRKRKAIPKHAIPPAQHARNPMNLKMSVVISTERISRVATTRVRRLAKDRED
jgi:hypothetical protein